MSLPSRRRFVRAIPLAGLAGTTLPAAAWSLAGSQAPASSAGVPEWLPKQNPVLAKETVGVSHRDLTRVRELVEPQPALARAAYDRGCGDGETALGAASQTGRREIAEFLIANGAQPTMCSATMLGHLDVVKAFVAASPGIQRAPGPHGIPLLAHARAGGPGSAAVLACLESVGGADVRPPTQPLAPADRDAVVGMYPCGPGPRDHFVVDVRNDLLGIERPQADRNILNHAGDLVFFPSGVPPVKIAFAREGAKVPRVTIADPQVVLTATRASPATAAARRRSRRPPGGRGRSSRSASAKSGSPHRAARVPCPRARPPGPGDCATDRRRASVR